MFFFLKKGKKIDYDLMKMFMCKFTEMAFTDRPISHLFSFLPPEELDDIEKCVQLSYIVLK